ncbi:hypothetical protein PQQ63_13600 [Paraburkholderia metrosideri]|uniref:Uncharacterized protein n=1 Tax=Paraburkholderia metrosideri TaxID=580937 RepID=A0ABW9DSU3_9BURK
MPRAIDAAVSIDQILRADAGAGSEKLRRYTGTLGRIHGKNSNAIGDSTAVAAKANLHSG